MTNIISLLNEERLQFTIYFGIAVTMIVFVAILTFRSPEYFLKFFGSLNPIIAITIVSLLGFILFQILLARGWFEIYSAGNTKGILVAAALAVPFAIAIILVDLIAVFPEDTNILLPDALLFYPAMGFVVDIVFHVLPLAILLLILTSPPLIISFEKAVLPCILLIAILEPIYQTVLGFSNPQPLWTTIFVAANIFLINLTQLLLFRRYDFVSMYSFRLVYYLLWHIIWGYARLKLFF
jgi:hypothetical protein